MMRLMKWVEKFMIEVLFGESEAASMKVAKNKVNSIVSDKSPLEENTEWLEGTADEVICLAFMLDIGEINQDICGEYRKKLIYSMFNQGQYGTNSEMNEELKEAANVYIRELERLKKHLDEGESIRIWYSRSAYSLCGLYYVCNLLYHFENRIVLVELPEYGVNGNVIVSYQNWGEIAAEEFASFIKNQKEIEHIEIRRYAQKWYELVKDNSPLRSVINNHVIGVGEDFYDFLIWRNVSEKPVKQARLIGDILGYYPVNVGDWWYARRIQHFIDNGNIEILEDSENKYARLIRRK